MKKVLFVCIGNICRSPCQQYLFEAVAKKKGLEKKILFDSCAISSWHIGSDMHPKIRNAAEKKKYSFPKHEAKIFRPNFYKEFDYIFTVTGEIYETLKGAARTPEEKNKVYMATHFSDSYKDQEVPDPYYGGTEDFEKVVTMIETTAEETLSKLEKSL